MTARSKATRPADLATWLRDLFIPLWIERTCLSGRPGYVEEVHRADGSPVLANTRSTLVTGRLVYSFSVAHGFDRSRASLDAARHGLAFLLETCRLAPGHFAHVATTEGQVIDPNGDLYDLAFVLLGLAGYAAASGDRAVLRIAEEVALRLDGELEDPLGGYREPAGDGARRRQFPQMHLFEAFQQLASLEPSAGWSRRAGRILDLAATLVDSDGGIDEWYASDWRALDGNGREREIGHHFEWAWLLYRYTANAGAGRARELADRLFGFGMKAARISGSGPDDLVPNHIDAEGRPSIHSRPLWPTTELLRATVAASAPGEPSTATAMGEACLDLLFSRSIDADTALWINETGTGAGAHNSTIPTRVLYHILPCLIDYVRISQSHQGYRWG